MTRAKKLTVDSFGPELLALLIAGAKERKAVPFPDTPDGKKGAVVLRHRLNTLRSTMRKTNHDQAQLVDRAKITIEEDHILVIEPHDSQFAEVIRQAGVELPDLPPTSAGRKKVQTSGRDMSDPLDGLVPPPETPENNPNPKKE